MKRIKETKDYFKISRIIRSKDEYDAIEKWCSNADTDIFILGKWFYSDYYNLAEMDDKSMHNTIKKIVVNETKNMLKNFNIKIEMIRDDGYVLPHCYFIFIKDKNVATEFKLRFI